MPSVLRDLLWATAPPHLLTIAELFWHSKMMPTKVSHRSLLCPCSALKLSGITE